MVIKHLVNGVWVEIPQNMLVEAFDHADAHGSAFANGFYKVATNDQGHVISAIPITKDDLVQYELLDSTSIASTFKESDSYTQGEFCIYDGKLYQAIHNISAGPFNEDDWVLSNVLIAAGSGGTVVAGESDWNAEQGDPGYIKNKPEPIDRATLEEILV